MTSLVRVLVPGDEAALARFFELYPDTTLFFQNNLAAAGLSDSGAPYSGRYAAALEDDAIVALASHTWNGNLIVEAPRHLESVARAAIGASDRAVAGLVGPHAQVVALRGALGLADAPTTLDSPDELFALPLERLWIPDALASGAWRCRPPRQDELDLLSAWREEYRCEVIGETAGPVLRAKAREEIDRNQVDGRNFVLEVGGGLVSFAGYNAATPHCVQIGGVWTPAALRSRGYARAVVAGALVAARERGVARSILFTGAHNRAAQVAYRALGYECVGDYGLVLFETPQRVDA